MNLKIEENPFNKVNPIFILFLLGFRNEAFDLFYFLNDFLNNIFSNISSIFGASLIIFIISFIFFYIVYSCGELKFNLSPLCSGSSFIVTLAAFIFLIMPVSSNPLSLMNIHNTQPIDTIIGIAAFFYTFLILYLINGISLYFIILISSKLDK